MRSLILRRSRRRVLNIVTLSLIFISGAFGSARAGDIADRHFWGFSPDGAYFAFEEFGVQDGSGFPYSNIYVINTKKNSWVKGSPIRVLIEKENATQSIARTSARKRAADIFARLNISQSGKLLAHNPATEINRNRKSVTVAPGPLNFLKQYALTFELAEIGVPTKRCNDYGDESQIGYSLNVTRVGGKKVALHRDTRIPTSRGCPKSYALHDVYRYSPDKNRQAVLYVVILQVFSYGFEGDDGRFLAAGYWLPAFNASN